MLRSIFHFKINLNFASLVVLGSLACFNNAFAMDEDFREEALFAQVYRAIEEKIKQENESASTLTNRMSEVRQAGELLIKLSKKTWIESKLTLVSFYTASGRPEWVQKGVHLYGQLAENGYTQDQYEYCDYSQMCFEEIPDETLKDWEFILMKQVSTKGCNLNRAERSFENVKESSDRWSVPIEIRLPRQLDRWNPPEY